MSILVIGGSGTVGTYVVNGLLAKGEDICVLLRPTDKMAAVPVGTRGVIGNLQRPDSLMGAMKGIDRVFFGPPHGMAEAKEGPAVVAAANRVGVRHFVYLSAYNAEQAAHILLFKTKVEMHRVLRASGMPFTLMMANHSFQSDLWYRDAILERGVYPQPIDDIGVSRVDMRDVAEAVVNVLTESGHEFQSYPLVGVEALTGPDIAQIYSHYLGQDVRYVGNDLESCAREAVRTLPDRLIDDLLHTYELMQTHGLRAREQDFVEQEKVLRRPPRSFHTFVRETAVQWTGAASDDLVGVR